MDVIDSRVGICNGSQPSRLFSKRNRKFKDSDSRCGITYYLHTQYKAFLIISAIHKSKGTLVWLLFGLVFLRIWLFLEGLLLIQVTLIFLVHHSHFCFSVFILRALILDIIFLLLFIIVILFLFLFLSLILLQLLYQIFSWLFIF